MSAFETKTVGERIEIEGRRHGAHRSGTVLEVLGAPGREHYLVEWDSGERSVYYPERHEEGRRPVRADKPARKPPAATPAAERPSERLTARPGDRLVIHGHYQGEPERDAEILEVRGPDGGPPFLVRWSDTGRESIVYPGGDAVVEALAAHRRR